jgi:hypothetical protein
MATIKVSQDTYDYKMIPDGAMAEAAGRVIPIGLQHRIGLIVQRSDRHGGVLPAS